MLTLQRRTWPALYVAALKTALHEGYARPSRDGETVDLGPSFLACPSPTFVQLRGRGGSTEFARLEQLTYLAGVDPDPLLRVAPSYERFREVRHGSNHLYWPGAYGPRFRNHMEDVVQELSRHPFSRRAVALVWNDMDLGRVVGKHGPTPKDIPCTISLGFWLGPAGEVRTHAHMRSTDLWFGLYYDLPAFAFMGRAVAKALSRPSGLTFLTTTSLHLYNKHLDRAKYVKPQMESNTHLVHAVLPDPGPGLLSHQRFQWLQKWALNQLAAAELQAAPSPKEEVRV